MKKRIGNSHLLESRGFSGQVTMGVQLIFCAVTLALGCTNKQSKPEEIPPHAPSSNAEIIVEDEDLTSVKDDFHQFLGSVVRIEAVLVGCYDGRLRRLGPVVISDPLQVSAIKETLADAQNFRRNVAPGAIPVSPNEQWLTLVPPNGDIACSVHLAGFYYCAYPATEDFRFDMDYEKLLRILIPTVKKLSSEANGTNWDMGEDAHEFGPEC